MDINRRLATLEQQRTQHHGQRFFKQSLEDSALYFECGLGQDSGQPFTLAQISAIRDSEVLLINFTKDWRANDGQTL